MKKITLALTALMFMGGVAFAHNDKACCKKGEAKTECSKEKKEACAKGEGCCSKDKKASTLNDKDSGSKTKAEKKAEKKAQKANS